MSGTERRSQAGFSVLELLIVLAIIGVVVGIGVFNGRQALDRQQERAAFNSLRQTVWQGATAASARGQRVFLQLSGRELSLRIGSAGGTQLRSENLPAGVDTNLPQGTILIFEPPGKIQSDLLPEAGEYWFEAGSSRLDLIFSIIGEVEAL